MSKSLGLLAVLVALGAVTPALAQDGVHAHALRDPILLQRLPIPAPARADRRRNDPPRGNGETRPRERIEHELRTDLAADLPPAARRARRWSLREIPRSGAAARAGQHEPRHDSGPGAYANVGRRRRRGARHAPQSGSAPLSTRGRRLVRPPRQLLSAANPQRRCLRVLLLQAGSLPRERAGRDRSRAERCSRKTRAPGLEFSLGEGASFFVEARYMRFNQHGQRLDFVPIKIGLEVLEDPRSG